MEINPSFKPTLSEAPKVNGLSFSFETNQDSRQTFSAVRAGFLLALGVVTAGVITANLALKSDKPTYAASVLPMTTTYTQEYLPSTGSDSANQVNSTLSNLTTSSLWIGNAASATASYAGFVFQGPQLPSDAVISKAELKFTVAKSANMYLTARIYGEHSANPPSFSSTNLISQRPLTSNFYTINTVGVDERWAAGTIKSYDVTPIVNEIFATYNPTRYGFVVKGMRNAWDYQFVYSANASATQKPRLAITYTTGGGTAPTPTVLPTVTSMPTVTLAPTATPVPSVAVTPTTVVASPTPATGGITLPPTGKIIWDWQIGAAADSNIVPPTGAVLMDVDGFNTSAAKVAELKSKGIYTVCYIDAGSWEPGRPDSALYPEYLKIMQDPDWPQEYFLDVTDVFKTNSALAPILKNRFKMCKDKGFDAVEPDNLQNDENAGGLITLQQQLDFNGWVADAIHDAGLAAFQKNGPDKILLTSSKTGKKMVDHFDGILNEECQQYKECDPLKEYSSRGKLALNVEYKGTLACTTFNTLGVSAIRKDLGLVGGNMKGYIYTRCN